MLQTPKGHALAIQRGTSPEDAEFVYQWSDESDFQPCLADYHIFCRTSYAHIGLADNARVGLLVTHKYDNSTGFLGPFIVKESERGKGYGYLLWQHAMDNFGDANLGCDAVAARVPYYQRFGFVPHHDTQRFRGPYPRHLAKEAARHYQAKYRLTSFAQEDITTLVEFDYKHSGLRREGWYQNWQDRKSTASLILRDTATGEICAMGAIGRAWQPHHYRISPCYARDPASARRMLLELMTRVIETDSEPDKVLIDMVVMLNNPDAVQIAHDCRLAEGLKCARMWTRGLPCPEGISHTYAVVGFECG
ncbi:hypothetical protein H4R34_004392 [Dimargaris verticillata]|uniref:N-acetyltransferase domain-containing protein n=1 Tax=Dimargaris verticillata TaxID=2761393 RepID=A0A9W8E7A5_9FUNG|nr:hypothetical protein H4R34_004392 [Dimargaris verticillata]